MSHQYEQRPQFFRMQGETVIICRSSSGKFLTSLNQNSKYTAPSAFIDKRIDFTKTIKQILQSLNGQAQESQNQLNHFALGGFLRMESYIEKRAYTQSIRSVFFITFNGNDATIPEFKSPDEILAQSDEQFAQDIKYIQQGGIVFPPELFAQEGSEVKMPSFSSVQQKEKLQQTHNAILSAKK